MSRELFIMFVVIDLYGVQERLHAEKRGLRRQKFRFGRFRKNEDRHFLSGRYAAVCRRVLLHRGIKGKIGNFRPFSGVPVKTFIFRRV